MQKTRIHFVYLLYLLFATGIVCCKPDYSFNNDVGGWLKLHSIPATWEEAFLTCSYEGAVLASPLNKQLANALHLLMTQSDVDSPVFLGTHDLFSQRYFVSVEGVPLANMEIRWSSSSINGNETGDCLTMSIEGRAYYMHRSSCKQTLPFICYKKFENQTMNECGTFDNKYVINKQTGSCYKLHLQKKSWTQAYGICLSEGGHLVILNDEEEARIVTKMFPAPTKQEGFWAGIHVGLLAWGKNDIWMTINGEKMENVFNNWYPGEPNNWGGVQNRGELIRNGSLADIDPAWDNIFVCEKSPNSVRFEDSPLDMEQFIDVAN